MREPRRGRGFTLVELLVVMFVIGILAAVAVPSFQNITLNNARANAVNDLVAAMSLARSEAVKKGKSVQVCPTNTSGACAASTTNWNNGWLVSIDEDGDGTYATGTDAERPLKVFPKTTPSITLTGSVDRFVFRSFGSTSTDGFVTACDKRGAAQARAVISTTSGRVRSDSKNNIGGALTCS